MRILSIYSNMDFASTRKPLKNFKQIHVGISYISSALKAENHLVQVLPLCSEKEKSSLQIVEETVLQFDPQLIAFTSVFTQYPFIRNVAQYIKERWAHKFLLIGGAHVSLSPDDVLSGPFDALCIGEGEYSTVELVSQLEKQQKPHGIPNLWIKTDDGTIEKNPTRSFLEDIDELPFPDRDMWAPWVEEKFVKNVVLVARGCPFRCTYCSNHALQKLQDKKFVRFRKVDSIMDEIRSLKEKNSNLRNIYLQAETIGVNNDWIYELCSKLAAYNKNLENPISFSTNYRIPSTPVEDKVFEAFEKANFFSISIGLESGSERIRRDVIKRSYPNENFLRAVNFAKSHGMRVYVYNMVGLPGETALDHEETVRVNNLANPDGIFNNIFIPYPGTDLHRVCQEKGLIPKGLDFRHERKTALGDMPGFTKKEIEHAYQWFEYRVYKGHKPFIFRLKKVLERKIYSRPFLNALYYNSFKMIGRFKNAFLSLKPLVWKTNGFSVLVKSLKRVINVLRNPSMLYNKILYITNKQPLIRQYVAPVPLGPPVANGPAITRVEKPIIAFGTMRTGTTLLMDMLNGHPEIITTTGPPEREDVEMWVKYGGSFQAGIGKRRAEGPIGHFFCLPMDGADISEDRVEFFHREIIRAYPKLKDSKKYRLLNANTHLGNKIGYIKRIFADASLLFLVRNPYAVIVSLKMHLAQLPNMMFEIPPQRSSCMNVYPKHGWFSLPSEISRYNPNIYDPQNEKSIVLLARYWRNTVSYILEQAETIGNKAILTIRYEDFIEDHTRVFEKLYDFCGLAPYSDWEVLPRPGVNRTRFSSLNEREIEMIRKELGDVPLVFGYEHLK